MYLSNLQYTFSRNRLIDALRAKSITDERVLEAIGCVPRERFLPAPLRRYAYEDKAYPIAAGQTISQPYTVALQTQLLNLPAQPPHPPKEGEGSFRPSGKFKKAKVLEVGTGSGYQCAVLCELGAEVYSIERQLALFNAAYRLLPELGYRPRLRLGDGYEGEPQNAPFDRIIVTAAAPQVPQALLSQLAIEGGILVIPVAQEMLRITRTGKADFHTERYGNCSFVPMLEGVET